MVEVRVHNPKKGGVREFGFIPARALCIPFNELDLHNSSTKIEKKQHFPTYRYVELVDILVPVDGLPDAPLQIEDVRAVRGFPEDFG